MQAWEITSGENKNRAIVYAPTSEEARSFASRQIPKMGSYERLKARRRPTLDHFYNGSMVLTRFGSEERKALDKLGWGLGPF